MKSENENLEKNISRLVKLAGDTNQPNKTFTDSLINRAIDELHGAGTPARERKSTIMTAKKIFAYAAAILVACGVLAALVMQGQNRVRHQPGKIVSKGADVRSDLKERMEDALTKQPPAEEPKASPALKQAHIEYTQVGKKAEAKAKVEQPTTTQFKTQGIVATGLSKAKVAEILANATNLQNQQRYEDALKQLELALATDPNNTELLELKQAVANAIRLNEQLVVAKGTTGDRARALGVIDKSGIPSESKEADSIRLYLGKIPASSKSLVGNGGSEYRVKLYSPCPVQREPRCQPPMAHGGTTPPNGEDEDAMFFKNYGVNPFIDTEDDHLSTFAIDVDTGSYTVARGYLHDGHLPPNDAIRVEEFVNYFKYDYPAPQEDDFALYAEAAPWQFGTGRQNSYLLRLALKGRQVSDENRKPAILTFVIDVSGSMAREDRLGLVKKSLRMLVENLRPDDKIGIAIYGSRGKKLMGHKGLDEKDEILTAIEELTPSGSTYAEEGIRIGYEMAEKAFKKGCINRVILCSDGVANVGQTGADDILKVIKEKADKGITLSAIGFGMGNYNDVLMEQLGDKGNGHYAYIDSIAEAKRIFEDNLTGTLEVIARDVKVQVDFNLDVVRSYRLIGYENRDVPDDKFRDDKYDGGEVGAGHSATALYELKLWPGKKGNIATTHVRYKDADSDAVTEFKSSIGTGKLNRSFDGSSRQFRLAATVAEFAEILRHSYWAKGTKLETVLRQAQDLAKEFKGNADVIELVDLVSKASQLTPEPVETTTQEE